MLTIRYPERIVILEINQRGTIEDTKAMDINQVRLANLLKLIEKFRTDKEFCQSVGISNTYLPQVKSGSKKLGDLISRRIEQAMGLEHGWIDHRHDQPELPAPPPDVDQQTLAALNAMQAIPAPLRDQLRRTIFMIAATCYPLSGSHDAEPLYFERRTLPAENQGPSEHCANGV